MRIGTAAKMYNSVGWHHVFGAILIFFLVVSEVDAVRSGWCEDNTLIYYDLSNNLVRRDCSILSAAGGKTFRGICKEYVGGADCWRTEGDVTPEYRELVRGYSGNATRGWDQPYNFSSVTTTTLKLLEVECPVCPECDYSSYISSIDSLEAVESQCQLNLRALQAINKDMYSREAYNDMEKSLNAQIEVEQRKIDSCHISVSELNVKNGLYFAVAAVSVGILVFVVVVWIKYEWIGDPKLRGGF